MKTSARQMRPSWVVPGIRANIRCPKRNLDVETEWNSGEWCRNSDFRGYIRVRRPGRGLSLIDTRDSMPRSVTRMPSSRHRHLSIARGNEPSASVMMGRYALDVLGQQTIRRYAADVAKTKDADHPLALVDHWQPADFQFLHVPHCLVEVVILATAMDAGCHHIARGQVGRIALLGQSFAYDVAVRHHANELIVISDWNGSDIVLAHQFRELDDWGVGANPLNALVHRFFDLHGRPPLK